MLKKLEYIGYDDKICTLKIFQYENKMAGLKINDDKGKRCYIVAVLEGNLYQAKSKSKNGIPL